MDDPQPQPPPRFQFSLRTALLLTPVLAGLMYPHVTPYWPFALIADGLICGVLSIFIGSRLTRNELSTDNQKLSGCGLIVLGSLLLMLFSFLVLFVLVVSLSGYNA